MERKNTYKKTTTKKTNDKIKKVTKEKDGSKKSKKNGFTLIELLAVIIILGILMIIAIPSVTNYINDSRKSAYVDTAKEIVSGTRNLVNDGKLGMYDTGTTYYIPAKYVNTENSFKSPYGDFTDESAYVGVIYDGKGYKYYWISSDDTGQGIPDITPVDKLDTDNIKSDLKIEDIRTTIENTGIGKRKTIKILKTNGTWENQIILSNTNNNIPEDGENSSGEADIVVYPTGKTKDTVVGGDLVKIGAEEFYVIKHDGDDLILLAHYNLNVGSNKKPGIETGIQDSEVRAYGTSNNYGWVTYSNINSYVDLYKSILEDNGLIIKEARLMTLDESNLFKETDKNKWKETTYWLDARGYDFEGVLCILGVTYKGDYSYNNSNGGYKFGVRPVIVI